MAYAWIITEDHLFDEDPDFWLRTGVPSMKGKLRGTKDAPPDMVTALKAGAGHQFKLYDDDGNLYYTGRSVVTGDDVDSEEFCSSPLNWAMREAGAVRIKWTGHPEWEVG